MHFNFVWDLMMYMFRTDTQPTRLRNLMPLRYGTSGCATGRPDAQPANISIRLRNRITLCPVAQRDNSRPARLHNGTLTPCPVAKTLHPHKNN